jgi:hypothetical protein
MWVSYVRENVWVCYLGSIGLILLLYYVKDVVLRRVRGVANARIAFASAAGICVPITWILSPDWDNVHVHRIAILLGSPIYTLVVPYVSFLVDLGRRERGKDGDWHWRIPLEIFIGVPAWFFFWIFLEVVVLGWVWM